MNDADKLLSLDEMIDYLCISREDILNYIKYLGLPVILDDGIMQFRIKEVDEWRAAVEGRWYQKAKNDLLNVLSSIEITETKDKNGNTILTGKNRIQIIYDEMLLFVSYFLRQRELPYEDQNEYNELIAKLSWIALIEYLIIWLENDKTARQNISAFLTYKRYISHDEKQKINSKRAIEPQKTKLMREAAKKLRHLVALQNEKDKATGRKYKRMPYKSHSYKTNYNYITLRFLSLYSPNGSIWDFLDLLFFNQYSKNAQNNTSQNSLPLPELSRAYQHYDLLLSEILQMTDERNYVISLLQLRKFEKAYRFYMFGKIAKYMEKNELDTSISLPKSLMAFFQMYNPNASDLVQKEHSSTFWILDDEFVEKSFKYRHNEEIMDRITYYLTEANSIITDVVALYHKIHPSEERETWSQKDFETAYQLLRFKYKSDNALVPLNLGKFSSANSKIFECLNDLYTNPHNIDQEAWRKAIEASRDKQK